MFDEQLKPSKRLTSLDVFRGITIAGMILVNMVGVTDEDKVYPPLLHADWNGWTPTDLVFPFFLFIVGVAMAFSLAKYTGSPLEQTQNLTPQEQDIPLLPGEGLGERSIRPALKGNKPTPAVYWRIIRRSLILFALGIFLNGFWEYKWDTIRIMGVLQRISLTYLIASLIVLNIPRKGQWAIAAFLLIGYWLAMSFIPVPGYGMGNLTRDGNLGAYCDRLIIGTAHLYKGDHYNGMGDPEGLFSTLPAVVTVLFGYFTGDWLRNQRIESRTSINLVIFALVCFVIGQDWAFWFPINKKLWTSSYVIFTAGWALLLLAACYEFIEVRQRQRWGKPFEMMGLNAISIFVASVLLIKLLAKTKMGTGENAPSTYTWIYEHFFLPWAGAINGSFLFALVTVLFWWLVSYVLYRLRWFIKV